MGKGSSTIKSGSSKNRYTKSDKTDKIEADLMKKSSFRVDEVAKELGCSEKTVRRLIKHDAIDAFKLGHTWRIKSEEIDRFTAKKNGQYKPV
jgi:excisionase family DNA binding protein